MKIKNIKGTTVADDVRICRTLFSKARGLMFSRQKNLLFVFKKEKIIPLHMFFVFYPIDVLFLDKDRRIVEKKECLLPFTIYNPRKKARFIVELAKGTAKNLQVGNRLDFNETFI